LFAPGIGHLLFIIPLLLFILGVIKVGKAILKRKKNTMDA